MQALASILKKLGSPPKKYEIPETLKASTAELTKAYPDHFLGGAVEKLSSTGVQWSQRNADVYVVDGSVKMIMYDKDAAHRVLHITSPCVSRGSGSDKDKKDFFIQTTDHENKDHVFVLRAKEGGKKSVPREAWIDGINGLLQRCEVLAKSPPPRTAGSKKRKAGGSDGASEEEGESAERSSKKARVTPSAADAGSGGGAAGARGSPPQQSKTEVFV